MANRCSPRSGQIQEMEPDFEGAEIGFRTLRAWEMAQNYGQLYRTQKDQLSANMVTNIEAGLDLTAKDVYDAHTARTRLYNRTVSLFDHMNILAAPAVLIPPSRSNGTIRTTLPGNRRMTISAGCAHAGTSRRPVCPAFPCHAVSRMTVCRSAFSSSADRSARRTCSEVLTRLRAGEPGLAAASHHHSPIGSVTS